MSRARTYAIVVAFCGLLLGAFSPASASAAFGLLPGAEGFDGAVSLANGQAATLAGSHPFEATTSFALKTKIDPGTGQPVPDGNLKDVEVELPAGLVGNAESTPKCTQDQIRQYPVTCPAASQVGTIGLTFGYWFGTFENPPIPIYNMEAPEGVPAQFDFRVSLTIVSMHAEIRSGRDYGLTMKLDDLPQTLPVVASKVSFWGVPADPRHDAERTCTGTEETKGCASGAAETPLLSLPTACSGPLPTRLRVDSWQEPGNFHEAEFLSHEPGGEPVGVEGCAGLDFPASATADLDTTSAASPAGLGLTLKVPQDQSPTGRAVANLQRATIALPEGMVVNAASAAGLGSCADDQFGLHSSAPASCPDSSKVGTVRIDTPLLDHQLAGGVYLARPYENRFGSLLALYIAAHDPRTGLVLKLAGEVDSDPGSGRLTIHFDENPQLPFSQMRVAMFGGARAPLMTPPTCGEPAVVATLSPFSGSVPVRASSSLALRSGPNGSACPTGAMRAGLEAGTVNPVAGRYSPFVLRLLRDDGTQLLRSVTAHLPEGLLAKLAGVPYCPDAAIATISAAPRSGAAQVAAPSCPAASRVGSVSARVGAGSSPFPVQTGSAYLAGPYKGAPLSLVLVTPALAGPFDLGNVVVRTALDVDPATTAVTATSDALPSILDGIPLDIRQVDVSLDRPNFTVNPTSCDPTAVMAQIFGVAGGMVSPASRFQVGGCGTLGFKPKLRLRVLGKTRRTAKPRLRAVLTTRPGDANIARAQVNLPHSEFLEQSHLHDICTRARWNAGGGHGERCPKRSIYGHARAVTPLLDKPLEGPVYLRSSSHKVPDLVAALNGQIDVELAGRVDSGPNKGIRTTFEFAPDAAVSKFVLELKGGKKGLLVNSEGLCAKRTKRKAIVRLVGQNGKVEVAKPKVANSCRRGGKARGGRKASPRARP
jgi:hypothetical protein